MFSILAPHGPAAATHFTHFTICSPEYVLFTLLYAYSVQVLHIIILILSKARYLFSFEMPGDICAEIFPSTQGTRNLFD
jgi:hypothetical protein